MPTYAYRCTECGTAFDVQQAFTDDALTVCPTCGGRLRKQYGTVGVTFNGSGFYRNDSRASVKGDSGSTKPDAAPASSGSGKSEGSSTPSTGSSGSSGSTSGSSGKSTPSGSSSSSGKSSSSGPSRSD